MAGGDLLQFGSFFVFAFLGAVSTAARKAAVVFGVDWAGDLALHDDALWAVMQRWDGDSGKQRLGVGVPVFFE